jgi:hypothetical protein
MRVWAWGQDGRGVKDGHCYFKIFFVRGGREGGEKMRRKAGDEEWTGLGVVGRCLSRAPCDDPFWDF